MKPSLRPFLLIATITLAELFTLPVCAQPMPREDVVDVPAISEGLCVSNVFQTNMVLQRDKPIHVWAGPIRVNRSRSRLLAGRRRLRSPKIVRGRSRCPPCPRITNHSR